MMEPGPPNESHSPPQTLTRLVPWWVGPGESGWAGAAARRRRSGWGMIEVVISRVPLDSDRVSTKSANGIVLGRNQPVGVETVY